MTQQDRTDVVVIGAGIIGLTCALRLQRAGLAVTVVTADPPTWTTSAIAAAVWYPAGVAENPAAADWTAHGFRVFARQAERGVPGVTMRPTRMLWRTPVTDRPWWAAAVTDLRRLGPGDVGDPYAGGWAFTAPCIEMPRYLPWLHRRFLDAGGTELRARLTTVADAAHLAPVLVNATGLAASGLCHDAALYPVRGQLVLVRNPGLRESVRDQDNPAGYTYIHPRQDDVVLGGTFEPDRWDTLPDMPAARAILRRCVALQPRLSGAPVIAYPVGLRPSRHGGVRLAEDRSPAVAGVRVVHNYGHGGAGVTLAWGCAEAVTTLVTGRREPGEP